MPSTGELTTSKQRRTAHVLADSAAPGLKERALALHWALRAVPEAVTERRTAHVPADSAASGLNERALALHWALGAALGRARVRPVTSSRQL